ncbi:MAG TPA: fibronectin type III domain-containing protein, partial [Chitinophagales bacterium]|nr:fibronectin type III domain-containing protein [Chitinophagales bacterium]
PEQFSVRKTSKGVVIDWDITQQEGAKSYEIYKRNISENNPLKLTVVDIAKGSFLDSDVKKETVYFYSIIAKGQYGISDRSAEKFVKY